MRNAPGSRGPRSGVDVDRGAVAAEVEVRRSALDLAPEEEVHDDVAVIDAADRPVGVHLDGETGRALETMGHGGAWVMLIAQLRAAATGRRVAGPRTRWGRRPHDPSRLALSIAAAVGSVSV